MTTESWIFDLFLNNKDKTAMIFDNNVYSYDDLLKRIEYYTKSLKSNNISKGSIVAINSDYSFQSISLFFALVKNKNIIIPMISNVECEITNKLRIVNPEFLIYFQNNQIIYEKQPISLEKPSLIKNLQSTNSSGLVLFSSGSTGEPKAMLHNFDNLLSSYQNKKQNNINALLFLTFDHIGGIDTMIRILSIGGTLSIPKNRRPEDICKMIEKYKITVLPSSPTFLNLMLMGKFHKLYDLSSLKIIAFGAEPMPESLLARINIELNHVQLQQKFGTSETNAIKVISKSNDSLFMKIVDENQEYKIIENELWLKSKTQVLGYLNASMESFTDDGWFRTGDLVEFLEDGYIKIIGREKEIINVGGQKVLPTEIESVILTMEEIDDCMVYGEINTITGQTVVCDVVLRNPCENIKKIIRLFCKNKLDGFKIPTKVNIVEKTNFSDRFKKIRRK